MFPVFNKHPDIPQLAGRLIIYYGELEYDLCMCLAAALNESAPSENSIRFVFSKRGEKARIDRTRKRIEDAYAQAGIGGELADTLDALDWCRQIRNQYAHTIWSLSTTSPALVNLESFAKTASSDEFLELPFVRVDSALLKAQGDYFVRTRALSG